MSDNVPYMTAELGVLQSQEIEHVLIIYADKRILQVEEKDFFSTLAILTACHFLVKNVVKHAEYNVLIEF